MSHLTADDVIAAVQEALAVPLCRAPGDQERRATVMHTRAHLLTEALRPLTTEALARHTSTPDEAAALVADRMAWLKRMLATPAATFTPSTTEATGGTW